MYQTLEQRRLNWERALCVNSPNGQHVPAPRIYPRSIIEDAICYCCRTKLTFEGAHWMSPRLITLVEWP